MDHLLKSLDHSLTTGNHYAALTLALTLPDICGWIQNPDEGSRSRCVGFFNKYLRASYTRPANLQMEEHVFLSGNDFYALRCAFLHEGRDGILDQRAREVLDRFQFVVTPKGFHIHCNQYNQMLQLQVDVFCTDVSDAVKQFMNDVKTIPAVPERMSQMLLIRDMNGDVL